MDKEFVKFIIDNADPRIKTVPEEDKNAKINVIYAFNYLYNPISKTFYNPKINKELKAIIVYNLSLDRIEKLLNQLEEEFLISNKKYFSNSEILNTFSSRSLSPLYGYDFLIGVFLFTVGVFIHLFYDKFISLIPIIISMHAFNYFYLSNREFEKIGYDIMLPPIWFSKKKILLAFKVIKYFYFYMLLVLIYESLLENDSFFYLPKYCFAFINLVVFKYISDKVVKKRLINDLWRTIIIEKYI